MQPFVPTVLPPCQKTSPGVQDTYSKGQRKATSVLRQGERCAPAPEQVLRGHVCRGQMAVVPCGLCPAGPLLGLVQCWTLRRMN